MLQGSAERLIVRLRDRNATLVAAWAKAFSGVEGVEISQGDIFEVHADAIISPANSFGFMDGGIDLAYSNHFGWDLQDRLKQAIRDEHDGELPVGHALVIETYMEPIRFLVSAPTMRVPMRVPDTVNAYLAFRAALRAVRALNAASRGAIRSVLCPGLATAIGEMPVERCAAQMYAAYANVELRQTWRPDSLGAMVDLHGRLLR